MSNNILTMVEKKQLFDFVDRAGKATYAGGGKHEEHPERPGFLELVYDKELPWYYRDSYTGHSEAHGFPTHGGPV